MHISVVEDLRDSVITCTSGSASIMGSDAFTQIEEPTSRRKKVILLHWFYRGARGRKAAISLLLVMVEVWWSLLGAAIPAVVAGQAFRIRKKHADEQRLRIPMGSEKSSDEMFVCERVCTTKRMLKKVGSFSKDPIPDTCVSVCGVSELDVCTDACARTVCVNQHQIPNWNDICLRRCQTECLKLSASRS